MNFRINDEYPNLDYFRIVAKSGLLSTMVIFLAFEVFHLSPFKGNDFHVWNAIGFMLFWSKLGQSLRHYVYGQSSSYFDDWNVDNYKYFANKKSVLNTFSMKLRMQ